MPLDPQCQAIVDATNQTPPPFEADDLATMRRAYSASTLVYHHPTPPLDSVANLMIPGPASNLKTRIYRPRVSGALPALVFFHGGGWAVGDLDTHDHLTRYLAAQSRALVMAVDYRLAPEHPFPAAFEDACAATRWLASHAGELNVDAGRIAVGGDSAGGNLAAAAALALRGDVDLALQLLIYPAVDFAADNASLRDNGSGYVLTRGAMDRFMHWYLGDPALATDWRASPQHADDHAGVAPAMILSAEYDPLRDEAAAYAETLRSAGVTVDYRNYAGMIHGFARMGGKVDAALGALDDAAAALMAAFAQ
ncbi:MAG: alpha/beta hydrolase [Gammaproteobacteria bacterium]